VRVSKRSLIISCVILFLFFFGITYELPYYIYKPGMVDELEHVVEVEDGYQSEGHMHLVTVSGGPATPIQFIAAKLLSFHEITPEEDARPEGISNEDYLRLQLKMMENSQNTSKYVAYKAAGKKAEIEFNGVYVLNVVEDMPAYGVVEIGDQIKKVDDQDIKEARDLTDYVGNKQAGEEIQLDMIRDDEDIKETVKVAEFEEEEKVGIGIQLVTDEEVSVEPEIDFSSGNIGGPSAGFIFALQIYDQLTEEDWTKGYEIVGTGEIDYDGNVHRIGGIDKKVVAAHRADMDLFFAPNEGGAPDSNYEEAKKVAALIDTPMEIIPIDTFTDALTYLETLESK